MTTTGGGGAGASGTVIAYDLQDLSRTAQEVAGVADSAREVHEHNKRLAARLGDCGSTDLSEATSDFLRTWSYGMGIIAGDADGLGRALLQCAQGYAQLDKAGTEALSVQAGP